MCLIKNIFLGGAIKNIFLGGAIEKKPILKKLWS